MVTEVTDPNEDASEDMAGFLQFWCVNAVGPRAAIINV